MANNITILSSQLGRWRVNICKDGRKAGGLPQRQRHCYSCYSWEQRHCYSLQRHCYSWEQGQIPSPAIFKHVFDEYNFSIISHLFDNKILRPKHALSKMYKQNASYLVKHSDLGVNNMNKICLKIIQKVLKWPLQYGNFQKLSGVACPQTPLELLFRLFFQNNSARKKKKKKKKRLKYAKFGCPSLKKFLE